MLSEPVDVSSAAVARGRPPTSSLCPGESLTPDAQLLGAFVERRDEQAFAALVRRHGPMVMGVCRRVLKNTPDAEDAFQATFLVLALKARRVKEPALLGNWLFGVAVRTARKARSLAARRRRREEQLMKMLRPGCQEPGNSPELHELLDEQIARLPDTYRAPIVMCYLEGRTKQQAARELGWPEGTVATRLTRGRDLLRDRLGRAGVSVGAGSLAVALSQSLAPAEVSPALTTSIAQTAALAAAGGASAAGVSVSVLGLTRAASWALLVAKMQWVALLLSVLFLTGIGAAEFRLHGQAHREAASLLAASVSSQAALHRYELRIECDVQTREPDARSSGNEHQSIRAFVDGPREDITLDSSFASQGAHPADPRYTTRLIWDGHQCELRQRYLSKAGIPVEIMISPRVTEAMLPYSGLSVLRGIALGDDQPMTRIVAQSNLARLRGTESVDGHACQIIEATTDRGTYTLWIDPSAGYQVRRAAVLRGPGDLFLGKPLRAVADRFTVRSMKLELHDVKLAQVEGRWIISSAVLDCNKTLGDGSTERTRWSVSRSELHPNPDFAALHAFAMDAIPDGTPVRVVDVQAGTQRQGVWRKGRAEGRMLNAE